jgi:NAD(P)H-hydrate epimerase
MIMGKEPFWLSRSEVRELDRRAIEEYGVPSIVLMENAGTRAVGFCGCLDVKRSRRPTLILCGRGNNGGDGFVIARHLDLEGVPVTICLTAEDESQLSTDCRINYRIVKASGIPILHQMTLPQLEKDTRIIDCLFGTGLDRPLSGAYADLVEAVNASGKDVVAIDIPSGLDCDTGEPLGPTIKAKDTITFVAYKKGFLNPKSEAYTGDIFEVDIGAPKKLLDEFRALRKK